MSYRNRVVLGSCEAMLEIPSGVVQTCVTSPPYWGLRRYHGDPGMIGLERTPEEWCERLVTCFREVRRVLRDDGTVWLNLGDAYNDFNGGAGPASRLSRTQTDARPDLATGFSLRTKRLKPKDLIGLPWMLAFALRDDGWWLRSDIVWAKPAPMPESIADRPTRSHEYVFLLSKSRRYFYDADAIREPFAESTIERITQEGFDQQHAGAKDYGDTGGRQDRSQRRALENLALKNARFGTNKGCPDSKMYSGNNWTVRTVPAGWKPGPGAHGKIHADGRNAETEYVVTDRPFLGANKRDVWTIPSAGYPGAHFATFPEELVRLCIMAGTSAMGECPVCGAPRVRSTSRLYTNPGNRTTNGPRSKRSKEFSRSQPAFDVRLETRVETTGWKPSCDHVDLDGNVPEAVPQIVLDPFMGSGTTAAVAIGCGRDYVGYEISEEYHRLIGDRMGLFA